MSTPLAIPCPHCGALNRVPAERAGEHPNCGRCKQALFEGHPVELTAADQKAQAASTKLGEPVRKDLVMVLQHIILSHHGVPEFGAAVCPKTPEAILVNLIDNVDAKTQMALDAVAAPSEDQSWTEYQKAFNTKLYRPSITIRE